MVAVANEESPSGRDSNGKGEDKRRQDNQRLTMPTKAPTPCSQMGCPEVTAERYCDKHRKADHRNYNKERRANPKRRKADQFYSSTAWRAARRAQLSRSPICVECKERGRITSAIVVDHIKPISQGGDKFNSGNLQSLCESCHNRKTMKENKGVKRNER